MPKKSNPLDLEDLLTYMTKPNKVYGIFISGGNGPKGMVFQMTKYNPVGRNGRPSFDGIVHKIMYLDDGQELPGAPGQFEYIYEDPNTGNMKFGRDGDDMFLTPEQAIDHWDALMGQ